MQHCVFQSCSFTHSQLSAPHTDVAHFAARVFLGVGCGQTHELVVPSDLLHVALIQRHRLSENHLQDDVAGVAEQRLLPRPLRGSVCQEGVGGQVQHGEAGATESIALRANRGQHQHYVVVGCVHTVEVCKVQGDVGVKQVSRWDQETLRAVRGVFGREARIKLCAAAEKDSM